MNSNAFHSFFILLEKKPVLQWILLALLLPVAYGFNKIYIESIWYLANIISGYNQKSQYAYYLLFFVSAFSVLLCLFFLKKTEVSNGWVLLGFFFTGVAVFYSLIIGLSNHYFQYRGIFFGRILQYNKGSGKIIKWLLMFVLIFAFLFWGIFYVSNRSLV